MGVNIPREFRIVHLMDAPGAAAVLARWFAAEWAPWYGPDGAGDAERDLAECSSRDALPICLVAVAGEDSKDGVLGTVALRPESVGSDVAEGPWLAGLLVGMRHRNGGVGLALVEALEQEAHRLGFDAIYTSTDKAARLMERRGWQAIGTTGSLRGTVAVYRRDLRDDAI